MSDIENIKITGFRGIKNSLFLNFSKNESLRSMIIYGRNGTGKSSITDAWEWFHTENIEHLRREGAGYNSFPHSANDNNEAYVEIKFKNPELGSVKLNFSKAKITKPISEGNLERFRQLAPHPCHIRFDDLTRFVYLTKSEKFDALGSLMGFLPQVEIQKSLRRVLRNYEEMVTRKQNEINNLQKQINKQTLLEPFSKENILKYINKIFSDHDIGEVGNFDEIPEKIDLLNQFIVTDEKSQKIRSSNNILESLQGIKNDIGIFSKMADFIVDLKEFTENENEFSKILLLDLYENGEKVLSLKGENGNNLFSYERNDGTTYSICPLCDQVYDGDLSDHISNQISILKKLKHKREILENNRKEIIRNIQNNSLSLKISSSDLEFLDISIKNKLNDIVQTAEKIEKGFEDLIKDYLSGLKQVKDKPINEVMEKLGNFEETNKKFQEEIDGLSRNFEESVNKLTQGQEVRKKLVEDYTQIKNVFEKWDSFIELEKKLAKLSRIQLDFKRIVDNYCENSINYVQKRFDVISNDVTSFFEILEQDTEGLKSPVLKLIPNEDRAVELQVNFHGETIYPAYKYLSESQLNSFGLSIFLASAKYFNSDFKFLILDDIINSFDGYKRPRVIELLKKHFSDHQILILTHDNVWSEKLFESFPQFIKKRFTRWEFNHGPIDSDGFTPLEKIKKLIDDDEPVEAGRNLGPYLERQLQEISEKFEVLVKYNRLNEYTLAPLTDRFYSRIKEKLGNSHKLCVLVKDFMEDIGFRNLCAHWKNPAIQLTMEEMKIVYSKWVDIYSLVKCQDPNCNQWLKYDNNISGFICPCGKSKLIRSNN